jgi:peroxiredoxin
MKCVQLLLKPWIFIALGIAVSFGQSAAAMESLTDFKGNPRTIADYAGKGKWLVVMVWASDCHVCNQEVHQYVAFHKKHATKDAKVLGISMDGKEKQADAEAFLQKHQVNFPSLIGEPEVVAGLYQNLTGATWRGTPSFMVYKPDGELIGAQAGAVPTQIIESFIERESLAAQNESSER